MSAGQAAPQSRDWALLGRAISGHGLDLGGSNRAELLRTAHAHGVSALLARRAHEGSVQGITAAGLEELKQRTQFHAALDMVLNRATAAFLALLGAQDIPVLLLKGTPLAQLVYPQSWLRPRCDTDVYVLEACVPELITLLRQAGYHVHGGDTASASSKQLHATRERFKGQQMWFDIHWKLSNRALFQAVLPFADCLDEHQLVPALGPHAFSLSHIDLLLHACIHRIAHGRNSERNRLLWLYDIHLLVLSLDEAGQAAFVERALERGIGSLCADALRMCQLAFDSALPDGMLSQLDSRANAEPSAALVNAGKLGWMWSDLKAQPGLRNKMKFAKELLNNRLKAARE